MYRKHHHHHHRHTAGGDAADGRSEAGDWRHANSSSSVTTSGSRARQHGAFGEENGDRESEDKGRHSQSAVGGGGGDQNEDESEEFLSLLEVR